MENHIKTILVGCRHNKRKWQKELYQRFHKYVFAICYRYEARLNAIEKLVNDSFLRVFRKIDEFDDRQITDTNIHANLQFWIKQIVVFACIEDYLKNMTNHDVLSLGAELGNKHKLFGNCANRFSNKQVIESIRELHPACRIIYNLFVIDGMPHEKIGRFLGISTIDSHATLKKARKKLREHLLGQEFPDQCIRADSPYSKITGENCPVNKFRESLPHKGTNNILPC